MIRTAIITCLFSVFAIPGLAQKTISSLTLQLSFPQDEYRDTYDATGVGIRWNILHRPNINSPLSLGGEIGFLINGSDARTFDVFYLGFYDRYRIAATNNVFSLAFKLRADLLPAENAVQLFVDGTVGTNLFFSSVDVQRETFFGQYDYAGGNSSKGNWSFVWGPGLGIEFPLKKGGRTALLVKGSYLFGSRTKYLTDPYIDNNAEVYFTERESETTVLLMEAGLRFGIFDGRRRR